MSCANLSAEVVQVEELNKLHAAWREGAAILAR